MGHSDLDTAVHKRRPWNAGQNVGPKRPLKPRDIWAIRFYLDEHKRMRDRALFDLAIDSKLRGCDLVKLKIGDVLSGGQIRNRATVIQQKTGLDSREYGTHSMRRTKASLIYKATGNLRAVQILLGHTNIENTVRYLGVDVDDALTLSERTDI